MGTQTWQTTSWLLPWSLLSLEPHWITRNYSSASPMGTCLAMSGNCQSYYQQPECHKCPHTSTCSWLLGCFNVWWALRQTETFLYCVKLRRGWDKSCWKWKTSCCELFSIKWICFDSLLLVLIWYGELVTATAFEQISISTLAPHLGFIFFHFTMQHYIGGLEMNDIF